MILFLTVSYVSCKNNSSKSQPGNDASKIITKDFSADFLGTYVYTGLDTLLNPICADTILPVRVIVNCEGTSNLMGNIKVFFDFCVNPQNGRYGNANSYFIDADKDTLFINLEGVVIPGKTEEHPSYVTSYWKDDFVIVGGTGKFENATGEGKTDDYNSSEDSNSHHHWRGNINIRLKE